MRVWGNLRRKERGLERELKGRWMGEWPQSRRLAPHWLVRLVPSLRWWLPRLRVGGSQDSCCVGDGCIELCQVERTVPPWKRLILQKLYKNTGMTVYYSMQFQQFKTTLIFKKGKKKKTWIYFGNKKRLEIAITMHNFERRRIQTMSSVVWILDDANNFPDERIEIKECDDCVLCCVVEFFFLSLCLKENRKKCDSVPFVQETCQCFEIGIEQSDP